MVDKIRFWCHTVLPLVYDDSLSYYELLCKVVNKVNEIIKNNEDIEKEWEAFSSNYESDIEQVVGDTIQGMIDDGSFDTLVNRIVSSGVIPSATKNVFVSSANYAPHEIYEVLKSYIKNAGKFYYEHEGGVGIVGYNYDEENHTLSPRDCPCKKSGDGYKYPIVCCELVELAMMGVPFERCRINTGSTVAVVGDGVYSGKLVGGEHIPYSGGSNINLGSKACMKYWGNSGNGTIYSAELAEMLNDAGLLHRINYPGFVELSPGDILFYAIPESGHKWNSIGHCDVFLGWNGNNMLVVSTDNDEGASAIRYMQYPVTGTMASRLKWYARLPKPGNPHFANNMTKYYGAYPRELSTNGSSSFILPFDPGFVIEPNTVYSCVIHADNVSGDGYINVQGYNSVGGSVVSDCLGQISMTNVAQVVANNTYNCLFRTGANVDGIDSVRISISGGNDVLNARVLDASIFDKLINPGYVGVVEHAVVGQSGKASCVLDSATEDDYLYFTIKNGFISFNGTIKNRTDGEIAKGTVVFRLSDFNSSFMAGATTSMYFYCGSSMYRYNHRNGEITTETDIPVGSTDKICSVVPLMKDN